MVTRTISTRPVLPFITSSRDEYPERMSRRGFLPPAPPSTFPRIPHQGANEASDPECSSLPLSSSLVFKGKPILVTPALEAHDHEGLKCIRAGIEDASPHRCSLNSLKCTRKSSFSSNGGVDRHQISNIRGVSGSKLRDVLQIYRVEDFRGCENFVVMSAGVQES